MTEKNYPEEIYETRDGLTMTLKQRDGHGGQTRRRAYDLGFRDGRFKERLEASNPLAGWSNLTEAIKAGEHIDWDALDGVEAKCVHPELGTLTRNLARRKGFSEETANGWCQFGENTVWEVALPSGWYGIHGWSIWVKGDVPLRKLTADQLDEARCFKGERDGEVRDFIVYFPRFNDKTKFVTSTALHASESKSGATRDSVAYLAHEVEVIEEYGIGTFHKPEGK